MRMTPEAWEFLGYLAIKWIAYCFWCAVAVWWLKPTRAKHVWQAVGWGIVRTGMGILVGAFMYLGAYMVNEFIQNTVAAYLATYVPVRVLEWGVLAWWMGALGAPRSRLLGWVLGGIAISCVGDVIYSVLWHEALVPSGRLMC